MKSSFKLIMLLFYFIGMTACSQKVYTNRSCGINGTTGANTVYKTQKYYNYEAANKRATQSTFMYIVSFGWL